MSATTTRRKDEHLDLCATQEVEPHGNSTLLDCVHLGHCAMPEHAIDDVDLTSTMFGRRLRAPLMITGMTGGTQRARIINEGLAAVAEDAGIAFGIGSQRAMAEDPSLLETFAVRHVAPDVLLVGNIGVRQAADIGTDGVLRLMDAIGADAMAVHLNAAQELTQVHGDRDFRGGYDTITDLVARLDGAVVVKETGCGIGPDVARRLVDCGVRAIDVSGAGGTSWVRVEQLRAEGVAARAGAALSAWGIPTAAATAAVAATVPVSVRIIASGGVRHGLDAARAIALGADVAGTALPVFRAWQAGGADAAAEEVAGIVETLRQIVLLSGVRTPGELASVPRVLDPPLLRWLAALGGSGAL